VHLFYGVLASCWTLPLFRLWPQSDVVIPMAAFVRWVTV
jgi:hypothetical protein